jgi:glucan phosphoethanolaminetransferase (alkaline phosphatase superfamily)
MARPPDSTTLGVMTTTRTYAVALLLQIGAGVSLLVACFQLFANWADAHVAFLGETATVEAYHVQAYQLWLGIAAASLVAVVIGTRVRRGHWLVPVLLGVVGAVSAVLFHVALPATGPLQPSTPTGNPNACYSGSNDCPGG